MVDNGVTCTFIFVFTTEEKCDLNIIQKTTIFFYFVVNESASNDNHFFRHLLVRFYLSWKVSSGHDAVFCFFKYVISVQKLKKREKEHFSTPNALLFLHMQSMQNTVLQKKKKNFYQSVQCLV